VTNKFKTYFIKVDFKLKKKLLFYKNTNLSTYSGIPTTNKNSVCRGIIKKLQTFSDIIQERSKSYGKEALFKVINMFLQIQTPTRFIKL